MPYIGIDEFNNVLAHYGVKGQKRGVRRWTNPDGTLTPEGYRHYGISPKEYSKLNTKDEIKSNVNAKAQDKYNREQAKKEIKSQIKQDKQLTKYENQKRKEQAKLELDYEIKKRKKEAELELNIKKANQEATRKNVKKYVIGGLVATGFAAIGYSYFKNKNLKRETESKLAILRQEGENANVLKKYDLKIKRQEGENANILKNYDLKIKQQEGENANVLKKYDLKIKQRDVQSTKIESKTKQAIAKQEALAKQAIAKQEARTKQIIAKQEALAKQTESNKEINKLKEEERIREIKRKEATSEKKQQAKEAEAERRRLEREAEAERKRLEKENAKKKYSSPKIKVKDKKSGENWFSQYKKKHTSRFQQYEKAQEKIQKKNLKQQKKQDKYYKNVASILNKKRTGERWYTNLFSGFNTYISQSDEDGISFYDIGNEYLAHYGVKGQSWGVRRYQNEDGTLTEEGRRHYGLKYDLDDKTLRDAINYERTKKAYEDLITSPSSKSKSSISGTIKTATDTLKKANNITGDLIGLSTDRLISNLEAQKKAIVIPKNATDAEKKALNAKKDQIQADIDNDRKAKKVLDSTKNAANTLNEFAGNDKVTNKIADLITSNSRQEEKAIAKDAVDSLSEQELTNLVNRLRLEQEYDQIVNPPKKSKNDIAREWLQTAGTILTLAGLGVKLYKNVKGIKVDDGNN